ncbi:MAG: hypothetical protein ACE5G7_06510, partial [Candidatus Hydrothermarchaeaceae archaeon]
SSLGKERFKAKLYSGTMPEVINIPLMIGSKGYGPWAKHNPSDIEQNPFSIVHNSLDPLDGHYIYDTRVKVYKA